MTVLLTGAGGFIGGHLCQRLRAAGRATVAVGRPGSRAAHRVDHFQAAADVPPVDDLRAVLRRHRPDYVYHLAGAVSAPSAEALYRVNLLYAVRLLEACATLTSPPTVILIGSAAEYGPPADPARGMHEHDPTRPVAFYGATKLAQTRHALAQNRVPVIVARPFNAIGVGMPATGAAGRFVAALAGLGEQGGTIPTGPLHGVRDLVAVTDVAEALVALPGAAVTPGRVYNLCTGVGTRMGEITDLLSELAPFPVRFSAAAGDAGVDRAVGDPRRLAAAGIVLPPLDLRGVLGDMLRAAGVRVGCDAR